MSVTVSSSVLREPAAFIDDPPRAVVGDRPGDGLGQGNRFAVVMGGVHLRVTDLKHAIASWGFGGGPWVGGVVPGRVVKGQHALVIVLGAGRDLDLLAAFLALRQG
jgi:hypothetical protein